MKRTRPWLLRLNIPFLFFLFFLPPAFRVAAAQCVPMMNDIRREIRSIHVEALAALHRRAKDESRSGWKYLDKNKRKKAAKAFRRALKLYPDCWDALAGQAHLAYLGGHPETGESLYQKSRAAFLKSRKTLPAVTARLKKCRERLGAVLNRLDLHQAMYAIQEKGESYDPSHQEERVRSMMDWIDGQLKKIRKAAETGLPASLCLIHGNDLSRAGNWKSAESVYRSGLKAAPENALLHRNLAICLLAQGRTEEAEKEARAALKLGASFPEILCRRLNVPSSEIH
ncbi:MAG: tetratricopeptide repeat protein [Acidobacteria bacterium]|nr:tetratricopeptide repeat protein [Acidobacteriota bacterium]